MPNPHPALNFIIVAVTHADLFGTTIRESELRLLLRTFRQSDLLILLAKIGLLLHNSQNRWDDPSLQSMLIQSFLDTDTRVRLNNYIRQTNARYPDERLVLFSEFQIVNMAKLAILFSSEEEGSAIDSEEERARFGLCCLMTNDLVFRQLHGMEQADRSQVEQQLKQELITNYFFQRDERFDYGWTRAHELFVVIPSQLKQHPQYFDLATAFHKATNLTVEQYLAIGLGLWSWWAEVTPEALEKTDRATINLKLFLKDVSRWRDEWKSMFDHLAQPLEKYKEQVAQERAELSDDNDFRYSNQTLERFPLVRLGEQALCLSPKFLARKLTQNIFFIINNSLEEKGRQDFRTFFGKIFEEYVRQVLSRCLNNRCRMDRYKQDEEAGEAILIYPRVLVIVEAKSSGLTLETIRHGDLDLYRRDIRKIVVKGCEQIERVIQDFQDKRYRIPQLSPLDIGRFYPVVVTASGLPQDPFLRKELEAILEQKQILRAREIAPVTLLDIQELEYLESILGQRSLVDLLGQKTGRPEYRDLSMRNFLFSITGGLPPNENLRQKFKSLAQSFKAILFEPSAD